MKCQTHTTTDLVLREGVSKKTGKAYSFYGCPFKENGAFCQYTEPGKPVANAPVSPQNAPGRTEEVLKAISAVRVDIAMLGVKIDNFIKKVDREGYIPVINVEPSKKAKEAEELDEINKELQLNEMDF